MHRADGLWFCRIYVEESLRINDAFTEQLEDDVADMQTIMGLGAREAADIRSEIVSKSYKCAAHTQSTALHRSLVGRACWRQQEGAHSLGKGGRGRHAAFTWRVSRQSARVGRDTRPETHQQLVKNTTTIEKDTTEPRPQLGHWNHCWVWLPCRRLLREQFRNGRLDAATSKAQVLEELCDKLNFDADAAAALHKQLYREKLMSVVADKRISGTA